MPAAPRIFLSYARTDGHQLATELRQKLEPSFSLYQDLVNLEGGKDWWDQIKHAIDQVEYLVLVITPNSLKSEYVGKEWSYARQKGVCVIPVFEGPEPDFTALPHKWMRDANCRAVSGSFDNRLELWECSGGQLCTMAGHRDWITPTAATPDGPARLVGLG